jgi:ferrochelatase
VGVVVMAYGTPRRPEDIAAYYTHIRRGNPPPPDLLADLQRRYAAIGGISPLAERTEAQRAAIAAALDDRRPGRHRVVLGQKHVAPFIEDAVTELVGGGAAQVLGLVLAPHYSRASVGAYLSRARAVADEEGVPFAGIEAWHTEPAYVDFLARGLETTLAGLPAATTVLFTAHSLPEAALVDDPYADQLATSAAAVVERMALPPHDWRIAWQSAGRTGDRWRGPDVLEVIAELAEAQGVEGVAVCPQGFVADHLEVLYDLDVDARQAATDGGLAFGRTPSLNDDARVMGALADRLIALDPGDER